MEDMYKGKTNTSPCFKSMLGFGFKKPDSGNTPLHHMYMQRGVIKKKKKSCYNTINPQSHYQIKPLSRHFNNTSPLSDKWYISFFVFF